MEPDDAPIRAATPRWRRRANADRICVESRRRTDEGGCTGQAEINESEDMRVGFQNIPAGLTGCVISVATPMGYSLYLASCRKKFPSSRFFFSSN